MLDALHPKVEGVARVSDLDHSIDRGLNCVAFLPRTRRRSTALCLMVVAMLAGCSAEAASTSSLASATKQAGPSALVNPSSPAAPLSSPTSIPTSQVPATAVSICQAVAGQLARGELDAAETGLADMPAGFTCKPDLSALAATRRADAKALVDAALVSPNRAAELASSALRIDSGNVQALALIRGALPSSRALPVTPVEAIAAPGPSEACLAASAAVRSGDLSRGRALAAALPAAEKECVEKVGREAAARESASTLQVVQWRMSDRLPLVVVAAAAFALGALLLRLVQPVRTTYWWRRIRRPLGWTSLLLGVLTAAVLITPVLFAAPWPGGANVVRTFLESGSTDMGWLLAAIGAAFAAGVATMAWLRARAPILLTVDGEDDKTKAELGRLIVSEVQTIADMRPDNPTVVTGGTDVVDSGVTAVLDTVTQSVLKALVVVWKALTTGLGDRVNVTMAGEGDGRTMLFTYSRGTSVVTTHTVPPKVSASGGAGSREAATLIAANIVMVSLGFDSTGREPAHPPARLYGTRTPEVLARCAVAARMSAAGDWRAAVELYARAAEVNPDSAVAKYGMLAGLLRPAVVKSSNERMTALVRLGDMLAKQPDLTLPLWWRAAVTHAVAVMNFKYPGAGERRPGGWGAELAQQFDIAVDSVQQVLDLVDKASGPDEALAESVKNALVPVKHCMVNRLDTENFKKYANGVEQLSTEGLNMAAGFAVFATYGQTEIRQDAARELEAVLRRLGAVRGRRKSLMDDPNIKLASQQCDNVSQLRAEWELDPVNYSDLSSLAPGLSGITPLYHDARQLHEALHKDLRKVAAYAGLPQDVVRAWWVGATDWLVAGRATSSINLYQRADIRGPEHAANLGDFWVRRRLEVVQLEHPEMAIPEPMERALMATTATPPPKPNQARHS